METLFRVSVWDLGDERAAGPQVAAASGDTGIASTCSVLVSYLLPTAPFLPSPPSLQKGRRWHSWQGAFILRAWPLNLSPSPRF